MQTPLLLQKTLCEATALTFPFIVLFLSGSLSESPADSADRSQ